MDRRFAMSQAWLFVVACFVVPATATEAQWADLKIQITYGGERAPDRRPVETPADPSCMPANLRPMSEAMLVDKSSMGIENFVVYLDSSTNVLRSEDIHPELRESPKQAVQMAVRDCVFAPHVLALRTGQPLEVSNLDIYSHHPSWMFFANAPELRLHPATTTIELRPELSEKVPTPIRCQLHPWMSAYVLVLDHPYFGISNSQGQLVISKLPVGKELTFRLWHESQSHSIQRVLWDGREIPCPKGRLKLRLNSDASERPHQLRVSADDFLK
jgi:hypothetical protein